MVLPEQDFFHVTQLKIYLTRRPLRSLVDGKGQPNLDTL